MLGSNSAVGRATNAGESMRHDSGEIAAAREEQALRFTAAAAAAALLDHPLVRDATRLVCPTRAADQSH